MEYLGSEIERPEFIIYGWLILPVISPEAATVVGW